MTRRRFRLSISWLSLLAIPFLGLALLGCPAQNRDTGEKVEDAIEDAADEVGDAAEEASDKAGEIKDDIEEAVERQGGHEQP